MKLAGRLARLHQARHPGASSAALHPAAVADAAAIAGAAGTEAGSDGASSRSAAGDGAAPALPGTPLDELRRKLAAALGEPRDVASSSVAPRPPPPPSVMDRFVRRQAWDGVLHERRELVEQTGQVGRMPLYGAASVDAALLALLALDPRLSTVEPARALYLDTETTGLGGAAGTLAFLVGVARFEAGTLVVEQLLLRSPADEAALLAQVAERVEAASLLVTFNGKSFDLPLLAARCVMQRRGSLPARPHLDLLHVARRLHRARLARCRLDDVEREVLGFARVGDISGEEVAPCYAHYLRSGDETTLARVVEHNAWDVLSMVALTALYGEPLERLHAEDLVSLARTLRRGKALEDAERAVERAVEHGVGSAALRVRAEIAKARGDRARALQHFEALCAELDDPAARLELAKLYEHHARRPLAALGVVERGTSESEVSSERRRARLRRKLSRLAPR